VGRFRVGNLVVAAEDTASVRGGDSCIAQNQADKARAGFQTNGVFSESANPMASESIGRPQARLVTPSIERWSDCDNDDLKLDTVTGIRRMKGVRQIGQKVGNSLSLEQGKNLLGAVSPKAFRGKRDTAMLALLLGCDL
jgi:hypothetical protein